MLNFKQRFGYLFVISSVGFLIGFGNQLVVSYYFGTSVVLDAYLALLSAANLLLFFVQPVREALVQPVFQLSSNDLESANVLFSAGIGLQIILAIISMLFLIFTSENINGWLGLAKELHGQEITLWFLPYFILFVLAETCNGLLLSFNQVIYQAIARLVSASCGIICIWFFAETLGFMALVLSLVSVQFASVAISSFGLWRQGIRWVWRGVSPLLQESQFNSFFLSLMLTYLMAQAYAVCERFTMINLQSGLLASFQYSVALVNVLISLLAIPLSNLLMPKFLADVKNNQTEDSLKAASQVVFPLVLVLLVCCCFTSKFANEIVYLVFKRGSFDANSVKSTTDALQATVFTAIPASLLTILSKILYSQIRGPAIFAVGLSVALSGISVILLGTHLDSLWLIKWHWLVSNSIGLTVLLFFLIRRTNEPMRFIRSGFNFSWRVILAVLTALFFTPEISQISSIAELLFQLFLSFIVFCFIFCLLLFMFGILHLPQKFIFGIK